MPNTIIDTVERLLDSNPNDKRLDKKLLQAAFNILPGGVGIYSKDGDLLFGNEVFKKIIIASNRKHLCNILDSPDIPQEVRNHLQANEPCESKMYFDDKGEVIPNWREDAVTVRMRISPVCVENGKSDYFVIISENITEAESNHHKLEEALVQKNQHLIELKKKKKELETLSHQHELVLSHMNTGLVYMKPDYTVLWKNKLPMYGDAEKKMYTIGSHCYEHFGRTSPCDICPIVKAHEDKQPKFRTFFDPSGLVLDVMALPIRDKSDEIEGYLLKLDNVTQREKLIKELSEAKEKAEDSEKVKMAFLENMSHEIRTPLNSIVGFVQVLNDETSDLLSSEEKKEVSKLINDNVDMLLTLVNDILDLSKLESGKYSIAIDNVFLSDVCRMALNSVANKVPEGVELKLDIPDELMKLESTTDAQRVKQLLINYLTNACKYTSKGSITLSMRTENAMGGTVVHFNVTDTGCGIPKDKAKKIFNRFEKLDDFKQGTGLGLNICSLIADLLNGVVYLDEEYTDGASFVFEMPLHYKSRL